MGSKRRDGPVEQRGGLGPEEEDDDEEEQGVGEDRGEAVPGALEEEPDERGAGHGRRGGVPPPPEEQVGDCASSGGAGSVSQSVSPADRRNREGGACVRTCAAAEEGVEGPVVGGGHWDRRGWLGFGPRRGGVSRLWSSFGKWGLW